MTARDLGQDQSDKVLLVESDKVLLLVVPCHSSPGPGAVESFSVPGRCNNLNGLVHFMLSKVCKTLESVTAPEITADYYAGPLFGAVRAKMPIV